MQYSRTVHTAGWMRQWIRRAALLGFLLIAVAAPPRYAFAERQSAIPGIAFGSSQTSTRGEATEVANGEAECARLDHSTPDAAACPNVPAAALGQSNPSSGGGNAGPVSQLVTNEFGDSLEVKITIPSNPYIEPFNKKCNLFVPYLGAKYNPCGWVDFYDANWATSEKAPDTNSEEDAEYDACGTLVDSGKTFGWHVVGTKYTLFGWHAGHEAKVPTSEPPACLGTWKLRYSYTQTFSDGHSLTDTAEAPFAVTELPVPGSARWGGGNPSEFACNQQCWGDPVNTATGDFSESTTDLVIPGRGPGLAMTRSYSSLAAKAGASSTLGRGWEFSYDMSLSINSETGDATVVNGKW